MFSNLRFLTAKHESMRILNRRHFIFTTPFMELFLPTPCLFHKLRQIAKYYVLMFQYHQTVYHWWQNIIQITYSCVDICKFLSSLLPSCVLATHVVHISSFGSKEQNWFGIDNKKRKHISNTWLIATSELCMDTQLTFICSKSTI